MTAAHGVTPANASEELPKADVAIGSKGFTLAPREDTDALKKERVDLAASALLEVSLASATDEEIATSIARGRPRLVTGVVLTNTTFATLPSGSSSENVLVEFSSTDAAGLRLSVKPLLADFDVTLSFLDSEDVAYHTVSWQQLARRVSVSPNGYPDGEIWLAPTLPFQPKLRVLLRGSPAAIGTVLAAIRRYEYQFDVNRTSKLGSATNRNKFGFESNCFVDAVCNVNAYSAPARSATIHLSSPAGSCSGTIVGDTLRSGALFVLTAAHCGINDEAAANSATVRWFYEISTCDANSPISALYRTFPASYDGLDFLYSGNPFAGEPDVTLLRLRSAPGGIPIVAAPWTFDDANTGDLAMGLHHPASLLKKVSNGAVVNHVRCYQSGDNFICNPVGTIVPGTLYRTVVWETDRTQMTASGSSGSGLFTRTGTLYGTLSAGSGNQQCSFPDPQVNTSGYGIYSLLGQASAGLSPHLNPPRPASVAPSASTIEAAMSDSICSLDIDGNGQVEASTDGVLILRGLLGLTGTRLTQGALGTPPLGQSLLRSDPTEIKSYIDELVSLSALDVDEDGKTRATTDGLIILRAILGMSGSSVLAGAIPVGSSASWSSVSSNLRTNCNFSAP